MKPIFFFLAGSLLATACRKNKPDQPVPVPVSKQVSFHIYAAKDYNMEATGSPWKWASGTVKLSIEKEVVNGENQAVWDTTFTERPLVQYPLQAAKFEVVKNVTVLQPREALLVKQEVLYGVAGLEPQRFGRSYNLSAAQQQLQVNVEL
ncbi:MAG: hypothetical protein ACO1NX_03235 [Chitinophagaceae bacterium]